ncbi:MAG TPA: DUF1579 domain-containing protein [bacterium]|jgi:hypothetical protein
MKIKFMKLCSAGLLAALLAVVSIQAKEPQGSPEMEAMMKKWEEMATPGEAHKLLDQFVGNWDYTSKFWMEGPDKPPAESKGSCSVRWILGGRFIQDETTGEMLGKPFQGFGLTGYDNFNKKYVSFWTDNSSTAFYTSEGTYNPVDKILSFFGLMDDAAMDARDKPVLYLQRLINNDKHIMEIHDLEIGEGRTKVAEMVYTRK